MEVNRLELSAKLEAIMTECGETPHLYFQPPESVKLQYPCIIYRLRTFDSEYADNRPYMTAIAYTVTYITRAHDSKVPARLAKEPQFGFDRYYPAESLHHYVYNTSNTLKEVSNGST